MPAKLIHELDHTTEPGNGTVWHCRCGYSTQNHRDFKLHSKVGLSGTYGTIPVPELPEPIQYEPARAEYFLNTDEIDVIKRGLHLFTTIHGDIFPERATTARKLLEEL